MTDPSIQLYQLVRRMLRPLVRVLLRRGMSYGEFIEAAKGTFVDVAAQDMAIPGRKQTTTRISTITGLSRKVVQHLLTQTEAEKIEALHKLNRAVRVLSGWMSDERFLDSNGKPLALAFDGEEPDFMLLVKEYSGDITARTIVDELERNGAIAVNRDGKLELVRPAYIPDDSELAKISLLSDTITELAETIEYNMECSDPAARRFQRKVYYDNIPQEHLPEIKQLLEQKAQAYLEEINRILVHYDRDHNKKIKGTGRVKAGLGIHYIEEKIK